MKARGDALTIEGKQFPLPSQISSYYNERRATGSHGWHTGFCCVYMVLVVGFGKEANGQRDSIQENTEMESMG